LFYITEVPQKLTAGIYCAFSSFAVLPIELSYQQAVVIRSSCSLARAMDGRISAAAPLALADQLPLSMIVKRGWSDSL